MTRVFLPGAAKCSQLSDPIHGTGSGGNRCTEACAAMVDVTYKIGPSAQNGADPERIMYDFTEWLNNNSDLSSLEDPIWISDWVQQHSNGQITISSVSGASFEDCKACVGRGHIAVLQLGDYSLLRAYDGSNPYQWNPAGEHSGHVILMIGYDDNFGGFGPTLVVNDPLRGLTGQPWDYSWSSVQAAGILHLMEVNGPALAPSAPIPPPAPPAVQVAGPPALDNHFTQKDADTWQCISNGFVVTGALYHQLSGALAHPQAFWQIFGLPLENAHLDGDGYLRQKFERCTAHINPNNPLDFALDRIN
jgi:hypothetical protein